MTSAFFKETPNDVLPDLSGGVLLGFPVNTHICSDIISEHITSGQF